MAKKKHKKRSRHRVKSAPTATSSSVRPAAATPSSTVISAPVVNTPAPTVSNDNWNYVRSDIRRVGTLVVVFVTLQIILWYLLGHTGLGPQIYNLIKVT